MRRRWNDRWRPVLAALLPALLVPVPAAPAHAARSPVSQGTVLVNVAADGGRANGTSQRLSINGDGRFVAFASAATNLVPGPANGRTHVYVRDLRARRTTLVDATPDGSPADQDGWDPMISRNGRYVLFFSDAANLARDTGGYAHVYLRDMWTGRLTLVDTDRRGRPADDDSIQAQMSSDGRAVVFMSHARDLVDGRTGGVWNVYLRDLTSGRTTLVSVGRGGAAADGLSYGASVDDSHRLVSFASLATNLVPGDTNGASDVFVRDVRNGTTERVSVAPDGAQGDAVAVGSSISRDGRYVAFSSHANNLQPGLPGDGASHSYVRDLRAHTTLAVDTNTRGAVGDQQATWTGMGGGGVVFQSMADNLDPAAGTRRWSVYRRDLATGRLDLVSRTPEGAQPNGESWWPTSSGDGRYVGFLSFASDVLPGDTNGLPDVYVRRVR